jgi:uncharacterized protein YgiM (DUF1202 family)
MNGIYNQVRVTKLITALLLSIVAIASVVAQDAYKVSSRILNMRNGQGTKYGLVLTLSEGDRVDVLKKNKSGWWFVEHEGARGYT